METITIEVPVTPATEQREIKLPCFRRVNKNVFVHIMSNKRVVVVSTYDFHFGIEVYDKIHPMYLGIDSVEIPESEFTVAYNKVNKKIIDSI